MGNAASTSPSGNQNLAVKSEDTEGGSAESPSSSGNVNGNNSTANANTTNTTTNNDPQMMFIDCGSCTGALEVGPSTTLAELYHEVVEEFDEEMIPGDGGGRTAGGDYSFRIWVQGVQPTRKQSVRLTVGEINRRNWSVRLVEHKTTRTAAAFSGRSSSSSKTQEAPSKQINQVTSPPPAGCVANENGKRLRETNEETKETAHQDGRPTEVTAPKPSEPQPELQDVNINPPTPSTLLQARNSEVTPSSSPGSHTPTPTPTPTPTEEDFPESHETNHDSNPSTLKRSRIFLSPEAGEETNGTNTNTNTSVEAINTEHQSTAVTPIPLATTTEAGRNEERGDVEHNNQERRSETERETPRATSIEMEMETETETQIEDKPIALSTTTSERIETFNTDDDFGTMDCDDDDDDDATVAMSLSPSSDRGLADSNEINDKVGTHDDKQPSAAAAAAAMPPNNDLHAKCDLALKQSSQTLIPVSDLEIAGVETWEEKNEKEMKASRELSGTTVDVTGGLHSPASSVSGSERTQLRGRVWSRRYFELLLHRTIIKLVRTKFFKEYKFPPGESTVQRIVLDIAKYLGEDGISKQSSLAGSITFCEAISTWRRNAQTLANKFYKDDKMNKRIPKGFPGPVLIMDNGDTNSENRYQLHEDYRRKNSPEFHHFVKRVLGAVAPRENSFKKKMYDSCLSEIFSPSDEAFALLFLYSDYDSWINTTKGQRKRKKFTRGGWTFEGRILYRYLLSEVKKRRKEQESKDIEMQLVQIFCQENGRETKEEKERNIKKKKKKKRNVYIDPAIIALMNE